MLFEPKMYGVEQLTDGLEWQQDMDSYFQGGKVFLTYQSRAWNYDNIL